MQLFIFSHWGCSIQWLSHLLCSIGVRQHLFGERNVALHWQSSKNAEEIIKCCLKEEVQLSVWENKCEANTLDRQGFSVMMSISTHHLHTSKWGSTWPSHTMLGKLSRDPLRRSVLSLLKLPVEQWRVLRPHVRCGLSSNPTVSASAQWVRAGPWS